MTKRDEKQRERMRQAVERKAEVARARSEQSSLVADDRQQDQLSVRAKTPVTARRWPTSGTSERTASPPARGAARDQGRLARGSHDSRANRGEWSDKPAWRHGCR